MTEGRKAEAVAEAAATADVEMEEAAVPAGTAAEAVPAGMTDYQWVQQQRGELEWKRPQKEGAAAVD